MIDIVDVRFDGPDAYQKLLNDAWYVQAPRHKELPPRFLYFIAMSGPQLSVILKKHPAEWEWTVPFDADRRRRLAR